MRKLFTFLFAALMSVGMFAATVTWNSSTVSSIGLKDGQSFTQDGVTLTSLAGQIDGEFGEWMGNSDDASFKFSTSLGNFTRIEITGTIYRLGGSGWTRTSPGAVWTGDANETIFGKYFENVSQIVFTIGDPTVAVTGVTLNQNEAQMTVGGETLTLTATVNPNNATDKSVTWSTSDANVATVENGVVTAVAAGNATITVTTTDGSFTATCVVTVSNPAPAATVVTITNSDFPQNARSFTKDGVTVSAYAIDGQEGNIMRGGSFSTNLGNFTQIEVTASDVHTMSGDGWSGDSHSKTWTGNASSVSFSGNIMGMGQGTTLKFTIEEPTVAVTGVTLNQSEAQMTVGGETLTLTATVNPNNATDQSVSWSTSDANVATVENGVVTAVAAGTATITVTTTDGSFTATCAVTVTAPEPQGVVTLILANLPEENRPATIELAGTFDEGTAELEKLETGWFIYNFIHASADATGKFRDKTNPNMVLCEFIPANGDEEGKWVQAIFKISDYGYWDENGWKGTACMWTEIDVKGEQYAWMENAPQPTAVENTAVEAKAVKRIVNGQLLIEKNGKIYNVMGAEVK